MSASEGRSGAPVAYVDAVLESLIPKYLERRRDDADEIEASVQRGDFEHASHLGHSMKGSGGGYGFDEITELGGTIERAAHAGDAARLLAATSELRHYVDEVEIVIIDEE